MITTTVTVVVVSCPFCGGQHRHGAPGGDDHGIRRSHCMNGPYQLVGVSA